MTEKKIGRETFTVKRDDPLPEMGPGHIAYGKEELFTNYRTAGLNLPFRQQIKETDE